MKKNTKYVKLSTNQEKQLSEFIRASLIGDGSIPKLDVGSKNNHLKFGHGPKQLDYLKWKLDYLSNFNLGNSITTYTHKSNRYKNGECTSYFTKSKTHPIFTKYRKIYYPDNIKIVNKEDINEITPFGLAIWYMDDGYLWKPKEKPPKSRLCTTGFSLESIDVLIKVLNDKFKIKSKLYYDNEICINLESMNKYMELIYPYILDLFKYKLKGPE